MEYVTYLMILLNWVIFAFLVGYFATILNPYYLYKTPGATLFIGVLGILVSGLFLAMFFGSATITPSLSWFIISTFLAYFLFVAKFKKRNDNKEVSI